MLEDYDQLPDHIHKRLQVLGDYDSLGRIIKKHGLNGQQVLDLVEIGLQITLKQKPLAGLTDRLQVKLGLDSDKAKLLAVDYIGYQLLPLQDYLGDVTEEIKNLNGDIAKYIASADKFLQPVNLLYYHVAEVWGQAGFNIHEVTQEQRKNYFNIIINQLHKSLEENKLAGLMSQSVDSGGLGVDFDKAKIIAEWTLNLINGGDITIKNFQEIDEIRQKVLGDKFTSVLEVKPIEVTPQTSAPASQLVKQMLDFLALPEVKQIQEKLMAFSGRHPERSVSEVEGSPTNDKGEPDYDTIKSNFYESINSQDRLGFVTALAQLFASGQLQALFKGDERYIKFWRNRVLKDEGLEGVRKFDENSLRLSLVFS